MPVDSKSYAFPNVVTGTITSENPAVDETETLGFDPAVVLIVLQADQANPNIILAHAGDSTNCYLLTGSTGVVTLVAVASGVQITGRTFVVDSSQQNADSPNHYVAFR